MDYKQMVTRRTETLGVKVEKWDEEDGRPQAWLGEWQCILEEDDEDRAIYSGETGQLYATPVGAEEYGNSSVAFYFVGDGMDGGVRVEPFEDVEPV